MATNYLSAIVQGADPMLGDRMIAARQDRQRNALAMEAGRAKLDAYQQQNMLGKAVGADIARNDLSGARTRALEAGDLDLAGSIAGIMEKQSTEEQQETQKLLENAAILHESGLQGDAFFAAMRQFGADDEDLEHLRTIPSEAYRGLAMGAKDFLKRGGFTLGPGQRRFDDRGNEVASVAPNKAAGGFTLGAGQQRYDAQGNLVASGPAKDADQFEPLGEAELAESGFRPGTVAQRNVSTGRIHILQSMPEGTGIRTARGEVSRQTQQEVRRQSAQAFNGRYDPVTKTWSFKNKDEAAQVLELAERATEILAQGDEKNIAAATRRALRQMRGEAGSQGGQQAPPPRPNVRQTRQPAAPQPASAQGGGQGQAGTTARQRATNPQTGEVIEFNPDTGQWEPVR